MRFCLCFVILCGCSAMIDEKNTDTATDTTNDTDSSTDTDTDTDTDNDTDNDTDTDTDTDSDTDTGEKCTGAKYEGGCWFLSNVGDHCENKCEEHGAEFDQYTCEYAGDFENPDKCKGVLEEIIPNVVILEIDTGAEGPYGCGYWESPKHLRIWTGCTDDAGGGNLQRICACTF